MPERQGVTLTWCLGSSGFIFGVVLLWGSLFCPLVPAVRDSHAAPAVRVADWDTHSRNCPMGSGC